MTPGMVFTEAERYKNVPEKLGFFKIHWGKPDKFVKMVSLLFDN